MAMQEDSPELRLVVMGSLGVAPKAMFELEEAIYDINQLDPDVVMVLGDLGNVSQGFDDVRKTLQRFNGTVVPAIGDRDLTVETCGTDEENIELFLNAFDLVRPYYAYEQSNILFVTLSTERHRSHEWQCAEVFLGDEQLSWFQETLASNPSTPTIVQCHAPVFGTKVPIDVDVHVRATNAYVNHNHDPECLLEIIRQHPQIVLWFSGHVDLSQGHVNSICVHGGVRFVHVGTHSSEKARDGARHSRVIDIQPKSICIRTFDHARRQIDSSYDYEVDKGPNALMECWEASTRSGFLSGEISGFHVNENGLHLKPIPTTHYLDYLDKPASANVQSICPTMEKIYVATKGGCVWEYSRACGLPLGAIYLGKESTCVFATDSHVWSGGGDGYLRKVGIADSSRFLRTDGLQDEVGKVPIKGVVRVMQPIDSERLLIGTDRRLYEVNLRSNELFVKAVFRKLVLSIQPVQEKVYVHTADSQMSVFTLSDLQPLQILHIPSDLYEVDTHVCSDFAYVDNQFCFFASREHHDIIKVSLKQMKIVDRLRLQGKVQAVLFDGEEIYALTEWGQLLCVDMQNLAIKWLRDLEMEKSATMTLDKRFVYVGTANPRCRWQEVQIIERRSDMCGALTYAVRTANLIRPELEIDTDVKRHHIFRPQLRAKVGEKWINLDQEIYPSREFEISLVLERGEATTAPSISSIKLKGKS